MENSDNHGSRKMSAHMQAEQFGVGCAQGCVSTRLINHSPMKVQDVSFPSPAPPHSGSSHLAMDLQIMPVAIFLLRFEVKQLSFG
jgi:hypothetical protein